MSNNKKERSSLLEKEKKLMLYAAWRAASIAHREKNECSIVKPRKKTTNKES